MPEDLSLITCSYNTPEVIELCLKSFVFHHGKGPHKIIIIENSTSPETQQFLDLNNVTYIKTAGMTHSPSVDFAFKLVKTQYALLIDTDVIFNNSIVDIFDSFKQRELTLLGELQRDKGGFLLYPRVAPYFCMIDIRKVQSLNINFHDEEKIRITNSDGFFKNIPINFQPRNHRFYDVGSAFYEKVMEKNLKVANLDGIENIVFHAESLSWALQSGIREYIEMGKHRQNAFYRIAMKYKNIDILNCFEGYI